MTHVLGNEDEKEETTLSKHNYSKYSNKSNKPNASDAEQKSVGKPEVDVPVIEFVKETVETVAIPDMIKGIVVDCERLNVRAEPSINGEVICVLDAQSEIKMDTGKSTEEWFYIHSAVGAEGYCMKKFIKPHL